MSELAFGSVPDHGHGSAATSRARDETGTGDERHPVYLYAGQFYASAEPSVVTTILGSCVSVCLWDRVRRIGGINHYLLATGPGRRSADVGRFGRLAIPRLIHGLIALGSRKQNLVAKVFGGADGIGGFARGTTHVGTKNVEQALSVLATHNILVVAQDVGGSRGRKLIFNTHDGVVRVRKL